MNQEVKAHYDLIPNGIKNESKKKKILVSPLQKSNTQNKR